ncbi:hypothetical protein ACVRXQ_06555 [Streptococcus panodentis]|uniref:Replication-relaxation n=1 Tax=Streptococcus panodentis TaxID=1581472 RepID=A0ABS5AV82_9STRE|nr:hypothetical protein [Streptococcus panodentis]MBP2620483.1 hypothetical protein [Streptococcus panodentis]
MSTILSKYKIRQNESGKYTTVVPSFYDKDYYRHFQIKRLPQTNRFPFFLQADNDGSGSIQLTISYQSEADFLLVGRQLSQLEQKILVFIARFRNVQKLQIQKEIGSSTAGSRLEKALKKLHQYFLIEVWEFPRKDKAGESARAYSITRNGFSLLRYLQLLEQQGCYQWETAFDADLYQPIRSWKIVDTYQVFRLSAHYKDFIPEKQFEPKPYTVRQADRKKNALGEEKESRTERQIFLRQASVEGELLFENPRLQYVFDLYPLVTEKDVADLLLQHWSTFEDDYRYLVLIVDSWDWVEEISQTYSLPDYAANILFFDLDSVQNDDLLSSLYQFDPDSSTYSVLPFKFMHP